ncbi:MAG: glutamate mutase L [Anaerolineae bacterium]
MAAEQVNSILVADLGSVHTRLALFDLVEGEYRLIASARARTTAEPPLGKVSLGVERAAQRMSELIGRQLLDESSEDLFLMPESEGHGVDAFLVTGSAGRPMRVFLVGLTPEISLASGQRVLAGSFVTITGTLCPDDLRSESEQLNALLTSDSDLILIVGGTDGGADDILLAQLRKVARALSLIRRGKMPVVLYAGNQALRAHVKALLTPYTTVFIARNVRPSLRQEQLFPAQIELALVYDDYRTRSPGGFAEVGRYSQVGVVPTVQGTISAIRYLSTLPRPGRGPLCLDIGSANSVLVSATRGDPHYVVRTDLGVGHSFPGALEAITPAQLRRWLPSTMSDEALWDYAYNKQLRPATIPATLDDLLIEQALAREIGRTLVEAARPIWKTNLGQLLPPFNPIIGAGAILAEAPHPGVSAMLLLDALQPVGVVDLHLDPHQALAALGVAAYLKPIVTVQALETGALVNLGAAFCPLGRVRAGRPAMRVEIRQPGESILRHVVRGGEFWLAPVAPGTRVEVTVSLARGLSLNGRRRLKRRLVAGAAGLIFDARGRPLAMPRPQERARVLMEWLKAAMGGQLPEAAPIVPPEELRADMPDLTAPAGDLLATETAWDEEWRDASLS